MGGVGVVGLGWVGGLIVADLVHFYGAVTETLLRFVPGELHGRRAHSLGREIERGATWDCGGKAETHAPLAHHDLRPVSMPTNHGAAAILVAMVRDQSRKKVPHDNLAYTLIIT